MLTQYKSHSLDRHIAVTWRLSPLLGNYVTPGARADAPRPALVRGLGRRHLPELQPAQRRAPGLRDRLRRGPHLPDGPAADGRAAHRERRGRDRRRAPRADRPGRPVRRDRDGAGRALDRRLPREAEGREGPARRRPTWSTRRWATTSSPPTRSSRRSRRTRRGRAPATTSAATSSRRSSSRAPRTSTTSRRTWCPGRATRERGYWRDVGTLDAFHEAHMDLISVDPEFNLYNREWPISTWVEPLPPAKFVFADDGARWGTRSTRWSARAWSSAAARCGAPCSRPRSTSTPTPQVEGSVLFPGRGGRPRRGRAQRDRRQAASGSRPARRSASTRRPTASASRSPPNGIVVIGKGARVEA